MVLSRLATERAISVQVASAGILPGGLPLPTETQHVLRGLGFNKSDLHSYRSRQLTNGLVVGADLVIGLARDHLREVTVRVPQAWDRTFTLKELVRRGEAVGGREPDEGLATWLVKVGADRNRRDLLGASGTDDVADPVGGPPSAFEQAAAEIRGLCISLSNVVWS
jgi:protein-tyrosine phosphatase